jgi:DNA polymerase V
VFEVLLCPCVLPRVPCGEKKHHKEHEEEHKGHKGYLNFLECSPKIRNMISTTANIDNKLPDITDKKRAFKAIVDCNSFYCSCERLFKPHLLKQPVVVLSNNDGCIVSRSDEAKKFGVAMAGPYFQAQHLIQKHNISVFSSNYNLYGDLSWRVMETLRTLSPSVEVYSVDEAFLDLSGIPEKELSDYALHIRQNVEQWTGISVSVGLASTKTLCKVANHIAKKNKNASNCVTYFNNSC